MTSNKIKSILLMTVPLLIVLGLASFAVGILNAIFITAVATILAIIIIYVTNKAADLWYM